MVSAMYRIYAALLKDTCDWSFKMTPDMLKDIGGQSELKHIKVWLRDLAAVRAIWKHKLLGKHNIITADKLLEQWAAANTIFTCKIWQPLL